MYPRTQQGKTFRLGLAVLRFVAACAALFFSCITAWQLSLWFSKRIEGKVLVPLIVLAVLTVVIKLPKFESVRKARLPKACGVVILATWGVLTGLHFWTPLPHYVFLAKYNVVRQTTPAGGIVGYVYNFKADFADVASEAIKELTANGYQLIPSKNTDSFDLAKISENDPWNRIIHQRTGASVMLSKGHITGR